MTTRTPDNDNGATIHRFRRRVTGADARDIPLAFRLAPDRQWLSTIDPSFAKFPPERVAIDGAILLQAYIVGRTDPDRWISYSRDSNLYAARRRYLGPSITRAAVTRAVDLMAAIGLLESDRARPFVSVGRQSTFRATPALLRHGSPSIATPLPEIETIVMRARSEDGRGPTIDYRDTAQTEAMRQSLATINAALAPIALDVRTDAPGVEREGAFIRFRKKAIYKSTSVCLNAPQLHRIFNGSWSLGGRFYVQGGGYQLLPGPPKPNEARPPYVTRADLTIDGEPVAECDAAQIHPRMIYAYLCATMPGDDAYTFPLIPGTGWTRPEQRKVFKLVFNTALNATGGRNGAIGAVAWNRAEHDEKIAAHREGRPCRRVVYPTAAHRTLARHLVETMEYGHPAIAEAGLFGSGIGVRLQRVDSDIIERVMLALLDRGIVGLPVHDSIIVQSRHGDVAADILDAETERALWLLRARKVALNISPEMGAASIA
jgi:hypothetical protein